MIGTVREIWRYPVKSMAGERLDRTEFGDRGLYGDRGWAVRNEATGEIHIVPSGNVMSASGM